MDVDRQLELLTAGAVDVISPAELRKKLERGTPLRIKLGIDPTASDIHLGFAVVLRRLRLFQDLGHIAVLIIGDFTAMVGDPSGKSATRPRLSKEEVDAHALTYIEQVGRILDSSPARLEIRRNSEWLGKMDMADVLRMTSQVTVARMLERDDFSKRYQSGVAISLMEFLYPLLQATDSVEIRADVELGGTDQLFNLIQGRHLQENAGQEPQIVLTTPLLVGLDGEQKMSKSLGNYVGIDESPGEQFGKLMSISDESMPAYFQYATAWPPERVDDVTKQLASGELHPNQAKRLLARTVVDLYHGDGAGSAAEAEFDRVFKDHAAPDDVPDAPVTTTDPQLLSRWLHEAKLATSNREAKRAIAEGSVKIDGEAIAEDREWAPAEIDGKVVQVGRRKWARIQSNR
ncbi:MAG: tyrosyl-tRNA synthetase [Actinomycetota bacterium]|nr:tyrosyl-tRNA synthetase [Actinomycetota bacterium]